MGVHDMPETLGEVLRVCAVCICIWGVIHYLGVCKVVIAIYMR